MDLLTAVQARQVPSIPATATLTAIADTSIVVAPGTSYSLFITKVVCGNTSSVLSRIDLKEGSGGTIRFSMPVAASGGGFVHKFEPWWQLPENVALFGALGTAVTDVRVNVNYFIALATGL